ncbi:putative D-lactate dehydrogenase [Rosellinia necatrix]|uniref:Putative D-lactate dehydrogenase n=1 Tax=Rosellinia necatrix TaxID=77044 RepID=A0A1W2TTF0_ROSNE|nr:putative D-lactate dehydrogenase [Rosellinia necatrix]
MKLAVFSAKPYDKLYLTQERVAALKANRSDGEGEEEGEEGVEIVYHEFALNAETASLAAGARVVCVFVNDTLSAAVLGALREQGVRAVLLRCAGYNNVDLAAAARLGLFVASVPSYSPEAVAEFAVALVQTLNRGTHRAYNRVREGNFSLDGLLGRTLHGRTVGVVGTGRIGVAFARIMRGFGCELLAYDPYPSADFTALGGAYGTLEEVLGRADVVSLHCPLTEGTRYLINAATLRLMKADAVLVNTSRGALVDTKAVIAALKARRLGGLALDVYEHERALFYDDHSGTIIDDDDLMRLTTFHNVLVCGHQAFFTDGALEEIAATTVRNLEDFLRRRPCKNALVQPDLESGGAAAAAPSMLARSDTIPIRI